MAQGARGSGDRGSVRREWRIPGHAHPNFFSGGPHKAVQFLSQVTDVGTYKRAIDTGNVRYTFGAWLGGFKDQDDYATVDLIFYKGTAKPSTR